MLMSMLPGDLRRWTSNAVFSRGTVVLILFDQALNRMDSVRSMNSVGGVDYRIGLVAAGSARIELLVLSAYAVQSWSTPLRN